MSSEAHTLDEFKQSLAGLLNAEHITGLQVLKFVKRFADDDEWLFSLSEKDFDGFMALQYQIMDVVRAWVTETAPAGEKA